MFAGVLLTVCLGAPVIEMFNRDRTVQDTNDEVSLVAVVLCVGIAVLSARTPLTRIRLSRFMCRIIQRTSTPQTLAGLRLVLLTPDTRPPTTLRI
jgi:hypothetical protein